MSRKKAEKREIPSSKTPQVMKLVEPRDGVNQVILAGKSAMPKQLRGRQPLSAIMRREAAEALSISEESEERVTVNLTAVVIDETAAMVLRRFNACDCDLCRETLCRLTAEEIPARFVRVSKSSAEYKTSNFLEMKQPLKKTVTLQMIRIIIHNKKRSFHD